MRELTTIGRLGTLRAVRAMDRQSRMAHIGWMGATKASFVPPSLAQVDAEPPGAALTNATKQMLAHFAADGVPSMHVNDPYVMAFEKAWNADPASWAAPPVSAWATLGPNALDEDGGYGPNVHDAASAIVDVTGGGAVPPVNTGAAPVAPPAVTPPGPLVPVTPSNPVAPSSGSSRTVLVVLALLAAIGVAYGAHRMMKKRTRRRRAALPSRAIVLT